MSDQDNEGEWVLVTPFWIDTDAYTDRDRLMFCCGVEFEMLINELKSGDKVVRTMHRENESRVRMLCGRMKRTCEIEACPGDQDPEGTWSFLKVLAIP